MDADKASSHLKTKMGIMIFTATAFVVFVLVVIGTPLPVYTNNTDYISMWELKFGGTKTKIADVATTTLCKDITDRLKAMEAFSIISIFVALVALLVGVLAMAGVFNNKIVAAATGVATFVTTIIVWTIAADMWNSKHCGFKVKDVSTSNGNFHYGASFGLFVTAWCLTVVETIVVLVL